MASRLNGVRPTSPPTAAGTGPEPREPHSGAPCPRMPRDVYVTECLACVRFDFYGKAGHWLCEWRLAWSEYRAERIRFAKAFLDRIDPPEQESEADRVRRLLTVIAGGAAHDTGRESPPRARRGRHRLSVVRVRSTTTRHTTPRGGHHGAR